VIKKQKKNNITPENIGEIMLSTIPGVSNKSAISIMKEYKTIKNLMEKIIEDDTCLNNVKMICESGQSRKLSKTCIENIKRYVLCNE
jgi:ERCC4-type nuclease